MSHLLMSSEWSDIVKGLLTDIALVLSFCASAFMHFCAVLRLAVR